MNGGIRGNFLRVTSELLPVIAAFWAGFFSIEDSVHAQAPEILYLEDFEQGWNGWTNDTTYNVDKRFAWVIGPPTKGPAGAHGGVSCAGTLNPGNDCYLLSPPLLLPPVNQYSNHLWLFYWQWQRYTNAVGGTCISDVKVRQRNASPMGNYWGPWNIIDPGTSGVIDGYSPVWRRRGIDLTLFSGGIVQLGFGHAGVGDPGWFIDDVEIWNQPVLTNWPGKVSFENGWQGWHTDHGIWDIGGPSEPGPTNVPDGSCCAGTALDGIAPTVFFAHLWSPAFYPPSLLPGEKLFLQFDQWHDYPNAFGTAVHWSQWWPGIGWTWPQMIDPDPMAIVIQKAWSPVAVDITRLGNPLVPIRLGFEHGNVYTNTLGWFVDNAELKVARFRLLSVERAGNDLRISWAAPAATTNRLQCSPRLGVAFTNVAAPVIATGFTETVSTVVHKDAGVSRETVFYRVRRWP